MPPQISTGDRTILGRISKRGNSYLRMLFLQAARVVLQRPANWPKHGFGLPIGEWFRGELRPLVDDALRSGARLGRRLPPGVLGRLLDEHQGGRSDRGHQLWTLLTLELWLRKHGFD